MSASLANYGRGDAHIPLGRMGRASDMVGVLLWLASAAGSWVTGAVVPVDGGYILVEPVAKL
jgi:NAD(P)-dependent dehydrogenase (short-subunit alcohol dehydrogenase family)